MNLGSQVKNDDLRRSQFLGLRLHASIGREDSLLVKLVHDTVTYNVLSV